MSDISLTIRRAKRMGDKALSLSGKDLYEIPNDIYQLEKLESLDLSNNNISSLDAKLKTLTCLKSLNLENNKIISLPFFFTQMETLENLNFSNNPLGGPFSKMLKKENQNGPGLKSAIMSCFTESSNEERKTDEPSWLQNDNSNKESNTIVQNSLVSELKEYERLLKEEQSKRKCLEEEIDSLKSRNNLTLSKTPSSQLIKLEGRLESRLEIDYNDIEFHEVISQGGFSIVHKATYRGISVAVKKIFDPNIRQELLDELQNEVDFMISIRHPSIVFLIGVVSKAPNLCIVMDYLSQGSLYNLLHKSKFQSFFI